MSDVDYVEVAFRVPFFCILVFFSSFAGFRHVFDQACFWQTSSPFSLLSPLPPWFSLVSIRDSDNCVFFSSQESALFAPFELLAPFPFVHGDSEEGLNSPSFPFLPGPCPLFFFFSP